MGFRSKPLMIVGSATGLWYFANFNTQTNSSIRFTEKKKVTTADITPINTLNFNGNTNDKTGVIETVNGVQFEHGKNLLYVTPDDHAKSRRRGKDIYFINFFFGSMISTIIWLFDFKKTAIAWPFIVALYPLSIMSKREKIINRVDLSMDGSLVKLSYGAFFPGEKLFKTGSMRTDQWTTEGWILLSGLEVKIPDENSKVSRLLLDIEGKGYRAVIPDLKLLQMSLDPKSITTITYGDVVAALPQLENTFGITTTDFPK